MVAAALVNADRYKRWTSKRRARLPDGGSLRLLTHLVTRLLSQPVKRASPHILGLVAH